MVGLQGPLQSLEILQKMCLCICVILFFFFFWERAVKVCDAKGLGDRCFERDCIIFSRRQQRAQHGQERS